MIFLHEKSQFYPWSLSPHEQIDPGQRDPGSDRGQPLVRTIPPKMEKQSIGKITLISGGFNLRKYHLSRLSKEKPTEDSEKTTATKKQELSVLRKLLPCFVGLFLTAPASIS